MTMSSYTLITMLLVLFQASSTGSELIHSEINQSKQETALLRSPREKKIVEESNQETFRRSKHTRNLTDRTTDQKATDGRENVHSIITRRAMDRKLDGNNRFYAQGRFSGRKRNFVFGKNDNVAGREFSGEKLNYAPKKESEERKFSRTSGTDVVYMDRRKSGETKGHDRIRREGKGFIQRLLNFNGGGGNTADEGNQWRFSGRKRDTEGEQWRFGGRTRGTEGEDAIQWRFGQRKRDTEGDQWRFGGRKKDTEVEGADQWRFAGKKRGVLGE